MSHWWPDCAESTWSRGPSPNSSLLPGCRHVGVVVKVDRSGVLSSGRWYRSPASSNEPNFLSFRTDLGPGVWPGGLDDHSAIANTS